MFCFLIPIERSNKAINGASLASLAPLDPNTPFNFLLSLRAIIAKNRPAHWGPLWRRYEVAPNFLIGQICESALNRQGSSEKLSVCPGYPAQQLFCVGQVA